MLSGWLFAAFAALSQGLEIGTRPSNFFRGRAGGLSQKPARRGTSSTEGRLSFSKLPIFKRELDIFPAHLLGDPKKSGRWYVVQTKSRQEKAIARHLRESSISYYLPQHEREIKRARRTFRSYLPLFPGYVFLHGTPADRLFALRTDCALRILLVADQIGLHRELEAIQRLLASGRPIVSHPFVSIGDSVRIVDGPFREVEGILIREKGAFHLIISVSFISASVAVEVNREHVNRSVIGASRRGLRNAVGS